jgi:hypothetical protein
MAVAVAVAVSVACGLWLVAVACGLWRQADQTRPAKATKAAKARPLSNPGIRTNLNISLHVLYRLRQVLWFKNTSFSLK